MKIIVSMDSYKGSISAYEAGEAIRRGILRVAPSAEIINLPAADGGEGTVDAMIAAGRGKRLSCEVTGPLGQRLQASYGVLDGGVAVLEMSAASGLPLVKKELLNPLIATTYGTGEMIKAALDEGYRNFLIGLGGSATNDGGSGMAQALGASLKNAQGQDLSWGGLALANLAHIDISHIDTRIQESNFVCAIDVTNPLCGQNGATAVYGPQKGVTAQNIPLLDEALLHYARVIQRDLGVEVLTLSGGGAAGGLGAGMHAFLGATFKLGIHAVLDCIQFDRLAQGASLVFTGEGHMDRQTIQGKVPIGVAQRTKRIGNIPVIALVGGVSADAEEVYAHGIDGVFAIADGPISYKESCQRTGELLEHRACAIMHTYLAFCR